MEPSVRDSLAAVGLTQLEAQAYVHLLEHAPDTAYGVAKAIGKPTANTYKAIDSLYRKGALLVDEHEPRTWRPVAPEELLGALARQFDLHRRAAVQALTRLGAPRPDDRVYRVRTPEQVVERMSHMLREARRAAVLDLFPWGVEAVRGEAEAAADRGVTVAVKVYAPADVRGGLVVLDPRAADTRRRWSGEWANAVVDGREHLLAWLDSGGRRVQQAIWSGSAFLSWVYHCGLVSELQCALLHSHAAGPTAPPALPVLDRLLGEDLDGYRMLAGLEPDRP